MPERELKKVPVSDDNLKLTFTCAAGLKADLERYAALHSQTYGEEVGSLTLIPHMVEAFMARDWVFRKAASS
jgi:hypothetical protein